MIALLFTLLVCLSSSVSRAKPASPLSALRIFHIRLSSKDPGHLASQRRLRQPVLGESLDAVTGLAVVLLAGCANSGSLTCDDILVAAYEGKPVLQAAVTV